MGASGRKSATLTTAALALTGLLAGLVPALAAHATPPNCTVGPSGADYTSIQLAVDNTSCSTVTVAAGVYDEAVEITRPLTLTGQPGAVIRPDGSTTLWDGGVRRPAVYITGTASVTVQGFEIDGRAAPVHFGVYSTASGNSVRNNRIHDITNSITGLVADQGGFGVLFYAIDQPMSSADIEGNIISNTARSGIQVGGQDVSTSGMFVIGSNQVITGNTLSRTLLGPSNAQSGGAIEMLGGKASTITGNRISLTGSGTSFVGIFVAGSALGATPNQLTANDIHDNQGGILVWSADSFVDFGADAPGAPDVHFNRLFNDTAYGLRGVDPEVTLTVPAQNNWWGCNGGPNTTGCDMVLDLSSVNPTPWLTLGASASPTALSTGDTSAIRASLLTNSVGMDTSISGTVPNGITTGFAATLGTVVPSSATTISGTSSSSFTAGGSLGQPIVSATVDSQTVTTTMSIFNYRPVAALSASPASGPAPLATTLGTAGTHDLDSDLAAWRLSFGDGSADSTGPAPPPATVAHIYSSSGTFLARLTVTDSVGSSSSAAATVSVGPPASPSPSPSSAPPSGGGSPGAGTPGSLTFYFAEGTTLDGFREYVLLSNPSSSPVQVAVTYYFDDGSAPLPTTVSVPGSGRTTIDVVTVVGPGRTGVSVGVSSPRPIVAERSMYFARGFPIGLVNGAHSVLGARAPRTSWDFAEGSTLPGFQEYLTLQNPGVSGADALVTFGIEGGGTQTVHLSVPGGQRRTLDVDAALGVGVVGHSTRVSSTTPILAERPMYFLRAVGDDGVLIKGGHVAFGSTPANEWDFAEGTLLPDFATYLTLGNPDAGASAPATITYYFTDGTQATRSVTVAPGSRLTVRVFDPTDPAGVGRNVSDPVGRGVSMRVTSSAAGGLVVERPVYFHHVFAGGFAEIIDGHDQAGAQGFATSWAFAEGSTLPGFFPFLTILNPGTQAASLTITYTPDQGPPVTRTLTAAATSRLTVQVYGAPEQGGIGASVTGFGIFTSASSPVLVERPLYVDRALPGLPEITGGSDVIGLSG
jgi:PKD domain-containing protein